MSESVLTKNSFWFLIILRAPPENGTKFQFLKYSSQNEIYNTKLSPSQMVVSFWEISTVRTSITILSLALHPLALVPVTV